MTSLTHPDIEKMERDGFLGKYKPDRPIMFCDFCGAGIHIGDRYFDTAEYTLCEYCALDCFLTCENDEGLEDEDYTEDDD